MGTVPTGQLERKLRGLYLRFVSGLKPDDPDVQDKIASFGRQAEALIAKEGGNIARLGAVAGFPAPKLLQLSPYVGKVYDQMQLATVQAGLAAGQGSKAIAQAMFKNGMDKSYRRLERLARTEVTSAYWKNTWDSTATLPGIVLVWSSETSPRTCHWCQERDGLVVDDPNIRDHPNGRCTLVPMARSLVEYRGTLQRDGSVVKDPNWGRDRVQAAPVEIPTPSLDATPNPAAPSVAQPAQASAPAPVARTSKTLADSLNEGFTKVSDLEGGTSNVAKVTTMDGRTAIIKSTNPTANRPMLEEEGLREELASKVLNRFGAKAPEAVRYGDSVAMEFVEGVTGWDYSGELNLEDRKRIGMFDLLTGNQDRHKGNYIVQGDGAMVPIDNGAAWFYRDWGVGADPLQALEIPGVAKGLTGYAEKYVKGDYVITVGKSAWTQAELAAYAEALDDLEAEFAAVGKTAWLDRMRKVLRLVKPSD